MELRDGLEGIEGMMLQNAGIFVLLAGSVACCAADPLSFEVASVKLAPTLSGDAIKSGAGRPAMTVDQARVEIRFMCLAELVSRAYRLKTYQVFGPDWMASQRYEIQAAIPQGASSEQVPEMLQSLLTARFKLELHRDRKDLPMFALIAGKNGLKLDEAAPDQDQATDAKASKLNGDGTFHVDRKMTMAALADFLSSFVDRPVVDMTETTATYAVGLDIPFAAKGAGGHGNVRIAGSDGAPTEPDSSGPSIFTTVQKLGLKLDPRKAPVQVLVVDRAEKTPTEN